MHSADSILEILTRRQFLNPHRALGIVLTEALQDIGACPSIEQEALERLGLDVSLSIGRLRRTELTQLARVLHRLWKNAAGQRART